MNIQYLEIKGFKSVADLELRNVSPFTALAGANGAGKSNIADALAFLGAIVKRGAVQAIREFGGFHQVHCFKFRKEQRTTISFALQVQFGDSLYDYSLKLKAMDQHPYILESLKIDGRVVIDRQSTGDTRIAFGDEDKPVEEKKLQSLPDYPGDMSALMLLSHSPLYAFLTNILVFRIDPISAKKPDSSTADAAALDAQGKNVATMLSILEKDDDFRDQILEWVELIVPGMESLATEKQRLDGTTVITFKEEGTRARFPAGLISDGTIYALSILTAVLSRGSGSGITIIEEPERGIHPKAIGELVALLRANASVAHPVIITTHSESVVKNLDTHELWLVGKEEGKTKLKSALESGVKKADIPLDTAWLTNLFDGGLPW